MNQTADVIVVGAGIIGAATAFELAKAGYRTLNIDRNGEAGHGSTSGSCAIIRVHYSTYEGTAFAYDGYFYWRDWADYLQTTDERGLATFRQTGCLVLTTEANGHMGKHKRHCEALDIPFEDWSVAEISERLPHYDLRGYYPPKRPEDSGFGEPTGATVDGGVFFPTAGYVTDPALSAHNLQRATEANGGRFSFNSTITGILTAKGRVAGVQLADGSTIQAPIVVNAAGPASALINQLAGVTGDMTISTRPMKQQVVHLPAPEGVDLHESGLVISDSDIGCYCRPELGGNILIGSEDPPCDVPHWVDDPHSFDRNFTDQWRIQALRYAQRVPAMGVSSRMRGVVDLYDVTEDWIPIYDMSCLPGFYLACGSSGNQFKNAPIAGKMMTALIDYCENGGVHDVRPLQFRLPRIDRQLNVGFFSRRRQVNPDSSFSVLG